MTKREGWVALLVLGSALSAPMLLHAGNNHPAPNHPEVPKQAQKASKAYDKQLKKQMKQQAKAEKKQMKQFKKDHPTTRSTT